MKVLKWLDDHAEETFLVLCLIVIACVMMLQVVIRKIPTMKALQWAEELCRFLWIMSVFVSLPYTIRKGTMLRVSVVLDLFPEKLRKVINLIVDVVICGSMALLAYHSFGVYRKIAESGETSPAMVWPMTIVYSFMIIGFVLGTFRAAQMIVLHIQHFGDKMLSTTEQTMQEAEEEANAGQRAEGGEA